MPLLDRKNEKCTNFLSFTIEITKMEANQETQSEHHHTSETKASDWYDRWYKTLLVIPIILLVLSMGYIAYFYSVNHDFVLKDTSLSGGTTITLNFLPRIALVTSGNPIASDIGSEIGILATVMPLTIIGMRSSASPSSIFPFI